MSVTSVCMWVCTPVGMCVRILAVKPVSISILRLYVCEYVFLLQLYVCEYVFFVSLLLFLSFLNKYVSTYFCCVYVVNIYVYTKLHIYILHKLN